MEATTSNRNLLWSHIDSVVQQLRKAFEEKECENVAQLLPELGNLYCRWRCQYLLHFGARNGWLHICRELVFHFGYSPIEPTKHGISPVHVAVAYGSLDILHFLLSECREGCENRDAAGRTPLHYASMGGKVEVVTYLITVMHCNPNTCTRQGSTPLHIACREGHFNVVKCLIDDFNCNPLGMNKHSFSALSYAACYGHCEVLCYLIDNCNIEPSTYIDDHDNTLLHYACGGWLLMTSIQKENPIIFNDFEALLYLIYKKQHTTKMIETMNHETCFEVAKYLVNDLHLNPNALNSREESALFIACKSGYLQIVKFLVSLGCSLHCQDRYRNTVLHNACRSGNHNLVRFLSLEHMLDLSAKNDEGMTALDIAARECGDPKNATAIVEFLIVEMKCDLSVCWRKKTDQFTPSFCSNALHWACMYGDVKLVSYLINQCGINANCRLKQGESPLHVACMAGNIDIVKLLINHFGCCSTVTDRKGTNLLHVAVRNGHLDVVKYLLGLRKIDSHLKTNMGEGLLDMVIQYDMLSFFEAEVGFAMETDKIARLHDMVLQKGISVLHSEKKYNSEQVLMKGISSKVKYAECKYSSKNEKGEVVKLLLTRNILVVLSDEEKIRLMHWACLHSETEVMKYLVANEGCDPLSHVTHSNLTTFHRARNMSAIRFLEDACLDLCLPELSGFLGGTPLHHAAACGDLDVFSYLVYHGCNPEARNWETNTPLHIASLFGELDIVRFLVNVAKCSITSKNAMNESPIDLVYSNTYFSVNEMENFIATLKYMCMVSKNPENLEFDGDSTFLLHYACKVGQLDLLKHLVALGFSAKREISEGSLPLHHASCLEVVQFLVEKCNAQFECKDDCGNTPLHYASSNGQLSIVQYLVKYCNIVCENDSGNIPLHLACVQGNKSVVDFLASNAPESVNYCNKDGNSPLHLACRLAHPAVVKLLLEKFHCHLHILNKLGVTPVDCAFISGEVDKQWEVPRYLYHKHAATRYLKKEDPVHWASAEGDLETIKTLMSQNNFVFTRNENGFTPMHLACRSGHLNVVKFLVSVKADELVVRNKKGYTPLDLALIRGHVEVVMFILNDFDFNAAYWNPFVSIPLHNCCLQESLDLLKLLTEMYHWDINNQDHELRYTPLMLATELGCFDIFEYLVTVCQCDVNLTNKDGRSALRIASAEGYLDMVQFLVEQTECNCYSEDGKLSPLLLACARGHLHIVDYFLKNDLYDPLTTWNDTTAVHIAAIGGHRHIIEYLNDNNYLKVSTITAYSASVLHLLKSNASTAAFLVSRGCDPNQIDSDGMTPLYYAIMRGNIELVAYFVEKCNTIASTVSKTKPSALYFAAFHGHLQIVKYLVLGGHCLPDLNDPLPINAIQTAAIKGFEHVFEFLLKYSKPNDQCLTPEEETLFHLACSSLSLSVIKKLLEIFSFSIEKTDSSGNNCLHKAAGNEKSGYAIFKYLVNNCNCNPKLGNNDGTTPLHFAVKNGNMKLIKFIVDECYSDKLTPSCGQAQNIPGNLCAAVNIADSNGYTPLHFACYFGHLEVVVYLITELNQPLNTVDSDNSTPLHLACACGHLDIVKYLVEQHHTNPNVPNKYTNYPIHIACIQGSLSLVQYLLEECKTTPTMKVVDGNNCLHLACINNHENLVQYLVNNYSLLMLVKNKDGRTPLHESVLNGNFSIATYLIKDKHCDPYQKDGLFGNNLVHLTALAPIEDLEFVQMLIDDYNISCHEKGIGNNTALHYACSKGHKALVRYLVEVKKCRIDHRNTSGNTPFHEAVLAGKLAVVKLLIETSVTDVNTVNRFGHTAVHIAAFSGQKDILCYLMDNYNCDGNAKDKEGFTPIHYACLNNQIQIVQCLIETYRCEVNVTDKLLSTPLHQACLRHNWKVVEYLIFSSHADPLIHPIDGRYSYETRPLGMIARYGTERLKETLRDYFITSCSEMIVPVEKVLQVFLLGDSGAGKTTLAANLEKRDGIWFRYFREVKGIESPTAGIVPIHVHSKNLGDIVLYDLAGHREFHSSHSAVMEHLLHDSPAIFVFLVNISKPINEIKDTLHYWITFIQNEARNILENSRLFVIGSHVDQVKADKNSLQVMATEISNLVTERMNNTDIFIDVIFVNCLDYYSSSLKHFFSLFSTASYEVLKASPNMSITLHTRILYSFLVTLKKYPAYSLCEIICFIRSSPNTSLPKDLHQLMEHLVILKQKGLIFILQDDDVIDHSMEDTTWVVVDKESLLSNVHGTLFTSTGFPRHRGIASDTGVITQSTLENIFPDYDISMLISFLKSLKFCIEINQAILKAVGSNLKVVAGKSVSPREKIFFFPSVIYRTRNHPDIVCNLPQSFKFGYCLRCKHEKHFMSNRFLHVLLLRLAYEYCTMDGARDPQCIVWSTGIKWEDDSGITTLVEMVGSSKAIILLLSYDDNDDTRNILNLCRHRSRVIKDILYLKETFCCSSNEVEHCLLPERLICDYHPDYLSSIKLYPLERVAKSIVFGRTHVRDSEGQNSLDIVRYLRYEPYYGIDQQPVFDSNQQESKVLNELIEKSVSNEHMTNSFVVDLAKNISRTFCPEILRIQRNTHEAILRNLQGNITDTRNCAEYICEWMVISGSNGGTYKCLKNCFDEYSIFCGNDIIVSICVCDCIL